MLHIRDDALASLGDAAPAFEVTEVVDETEDEYIARTVRGTFTVPNYLTGDGGPGNRFFYGEGVTPVADEMPVRNGDLTATFECRISGLLRRRRRAGPHLAVRPRPPRQRGRGGRAQRPPVRVRAQHRLLRTKWAGMSEDDIGNAAATLMEFSNFPTMADRLQQGVLNQIVLGRLMKAADGLASDPAFQFDDGTPLIDTEHLFYDGNSQGGIMGLMLAAVSPDIERAVVGVVGMNYSMLLPRSVDFDTYEAIMIPAYPNALDRALVLSWPAALGPRRGRGLRAAHLVGPVPGHRGQAGAAPRGAGRPPGDRDLRLRRGAGDRCGCAPASRRGGSPGLRRRVLVRPRAAHYPSDGSGIVLWDSGSPAIPLVGLPPRDGRDPHEDPRYDVDVRQQKSDFLQPDGQIVDVCGPAACPSDIDPRD